MEGVVGWTPGEFWDMLQVRPFFNHPGDEVDHFFRAILGRRLRPQGTPISEEIHKAKFCLCYIFSNAYISAVLEAI